MHAHGCLRPNPVPKCSRCSPYPELVRDCFWQYLADQYTLHEALERAFSEEITCALGDLSEGATQEEGATAALCKLGALSLDRCARKHHLMSRRRRTPWLELGFGLARRGGVFFFFFLDYWWRVPCHRTNAIERAIRQSYDLAQGKVRCGNDVSLGDRCSREWWESYKFDVRIMMRSIVQARARAYQFCRGCLSNEWPGVSAKSESDKGVCQVSITRPCDSAKNAFLVSQDFNSIATIKLPLQWLVQEDRRQRQTEPGSFWRS